MRRLKEGTLLVLLQSGLNESWWAHSLECYTFLRNVTDLLSDGKTPYERRFGQPFRGPIIPFGSLVEYRPIIAKDQSRIHQFGKKVFTYPLEKTQCERGDISQTKRINFSNRRRTNQNPWKRSGTEWEHPLWRGIDQFKERVILTCLENQKGPIHNVKTRFRMPVKQQMTFGPLQKCYQKYSYEFGC